MTPQSNTKRNVTLGFSVTTLEEQAVKRKMVQDGYTSVAQWLRDTVNGVLEGRSSVEEDRQLMLAELVQASQAIGSRTSKQIADEFAKREATAVAEHDLRMKAMSSFIRSSMTQYSAQVTELKHSIQDALNVRQQ